MGSRKFKWKFLLIFFTGFIIIFFLTVKTPTTYRSIPKPHGPSATCPLWISEDSITPLNDTKHLLVSAYMDQRVKGFDIRIIDVMCPIPENCAATHVSLLTKPDRVGVFNQPWLPIRNRKKENKLQFDFTVCVSNLFGDYNNVLQYAQTLEMYRLLGVNRVVIYNTSCGPDLDRLLQSYSQEGFLEIVPWPIDQHLNPSRGWLFSEHGGDVHYFGQLTTLNECVYRSMDRSRYVLLNDIDEIVMPYQHDNLQALMDMLQKQHPDTGVFLIENHIFPKTHFEPSGRFHLRQWNEVAGVNILEHIYREEPARNIYHPYKLIVQPRLVEQTSVHEVLKNSGPWFKVPPDVCRLIHVRVALRGSLKLEELNVDKRLWTFSAKLIPNVDKQLKKVGLLTSEGGELTDRRVEQVLLNDIDEIVMPYQHDNLQALMDMLQTQHRNVGVFLIENHMFSKIYYNESIHDPLARWNRVPGFNILENIYREEVDRKVSHPYKMILQPRTVEQTSAHAVLKSSGRIFKVPPDVCRVIHSPIRPTVRRLRRLHLDTRLWDFGDELSPRVSRVLRRAGLLSSEEQS